MKKLITLASIITLIASTSSMATVWRVNNQDDTADYQDLDVAHNSNAVQAFDTLYVEGSTVAYASITCTKPLTFIGPGYFLNINQKSAQMVPASLGSLTFNPGSEGSRVIGLNFDVFSSNGPDIYVNNISIERCYIRGYVQIDDVNGVVVAGNYCSGLARATTGSKFYNVYFNNNIVTSWMDIPNTSTIQSCNNNIFMGNSYEFTAYHFRNNIFIDGAASIEIQSQFIENNIATNNILPTTGNTNVSNIDALFVGGESPDAKYLLSENSQAKGAGFDGVDCGIFGGNNPYMISGLPPLPAITNLNVDDAATVETGLNVNVKVSSF